jgi:spermidine synthase
MVKLYFILLLLILLLILLQLNNKVVIENFDSNPYKIIEHVKTNVQDIKVIELRNKDTCLMIDDEIQFCNEMQYQDILVKIPKSLLPKITNVLLIGTGDNVILKTLLKNENIKRIDLIDMDREIFKISQKYFFKDLQQNKKVNFIIGDVVSMIDSAPKFFYDLIIIDVFNQPQRNKSVNSESFLQKCKNRLKQHHSILIKKGGFTDSDNDKISKSRKNEKIELEKHRDLQVVISGMFKYAQVFHIKTYKEMPYNICSNNIDVKYYDFNDDRLL